VAPAISVGESNGIAMEKIANAAEGSPLPAGVDAALRAFKAARAGKPEKAVHLKSVPHEERVSVPAAPENDREIEGGADTAGVHPRIPAGSPVSAPKDEPLAAAPATPEAPPPVEKPLSSGWAAVKRAEAAILKREQALKAQEAALPQRQQATVTRIETALKKDPFGALASVGWTLDKLMELAKNPQAPRAAAPAPAESTETAALKAELAQVKTAIQNQQVGGYLQGVMVEMSKPQYELLRAYPQAKDAVIEFIKGVAQTKGVLLTPEQACGTLQLQYRELLRQQGSNKAVRDALGMASSSAVPLPPPAAPVVSEPAKSPRHFAKRPEAKEKEQHPAERAAALVNREQKSIQSAAQMLRAGGFGSK
jgi:hypothetical protein